MKPNRHTQALLDYKTKMYNRIYNVDPVLAASLRDIRLDWYRITNNSGTVDETSEVYIYDEIGGSFGVDAQEFVRELSAITSPKIVVRINSPGGDLFDSIAIHNALVQHQAKIVTRVDALAASGASIIAMAGDEVEMMNGSQLMIHDALGIEMGNATMMEAMARFLHIQSDNIADMYKAKAHNGTREEWRARMLAETWMFSDEAINLGLADRVYVKPVEDADNEEAPAPESETVEAIEEVPLQLLMSREHKLTNRGFKYAGRKAAPAPLNSWDAVRNAVAAWGN